MSRVVVLGADGFIGTPLVKALTNKEDIDEIVAFDRFSSYQDSTDHPFRDLSKVRVVAGDFSNRAEVSATLNGADNVFHLISYTNPMSSSQDPFIDIDTNVRNSIQLFELCVEQGVKKVIFPSSGGTVYGDIDSEKIDELTPPAPRSPYGIGKVTIEHYLRYFKAAHGLDYVVYRIANPYGPGQNIHGKQGVIPIFIYKFLTKAPLTVFGDGSMVRDYIYIDDLINMLVGSFAKEGQHSVYNVGSGHGISVNELIGAMEKYIGVAADKQQLEVPPTFVHKSVLDSSRFTDEFGIQAVTSLDEGIARTWDYVQSL
jgi:UDP-glucose 4-epimerase